jgi:hypothetical protein
MKRHKPVILYGFWCFFSKGRIEGVWKQSAEKGVWISDRWIIKEWRKLHEEELHNLRLPPSICMQIKSRRARCREVQQCGGSKKRVEKFG